MSAKRKLIKDNLLLLVGGNIGNVFSFLFNVVLLRADANLANLYVAYNSIILILSVPALVAMRTLTIYGDSIFGKFKSYYERNKNKSTLVIVVLLVALLALTLLVKISTEESNFVTSGLIIIVAISTFITYSFRGLKQHEENFLAPVISLNIETAGRLILGYILGVWFGLGIYGVLIAAFVTLLLSLIPCFEWGYLNNQSHNVDEYKLRNALANSFILTAGTEFFSNFDVAYSLRVLHEDSNAQTEFTVLQIFRKIIFYGIFIASSLILSVGSKDRHSRKFVFFYTLGSGLVIGLISAAACFIARDIVLIVLKKDLVLVDDKTLIIFLVFTALMSSAYLLSNWLLSLKKKLITFIPIIASLIQIILFGIAEKSLNGLLNAFIYSTTVFFLLTVTAGVYEVFINKKNG